MLFKVFLLTVSLVYSQCQVWNAPCDPSALNSCNCENTYATCHWWGDPHTNTFDGKWHHFQGQVYNTQTQSPVYRYVSPCTSDFQLVPFQILSGHRLCPNTNWLCNWFNFIRLYDLNGAHVTTITVWAGGVYDPMTIPFPHYAAANTNYYYDTNTNSGAYYRVTINGGWTTVNVWTSKLCTGQYDFRFRSSSSMLNIYVDLNEYYQYLTCGLCGFYSGCTRDEFIIGPTTSNNCPTYINYIPDWTYQYSNNDWTLLNQFGNSWEDEGPYIRRLQPFVDPFLDLGNELDEDTVNDMIDDIQTTFPELDEDTVNNCAVDAVVICEVFDDFCVRGVCGLLEGAEEQQFIDEKIPVQEEFDPRDPALDL